MTTHTQETLARTISEMDRIIAEHIAGMPAQISPIIVMVDKANREYADAIRSFDQTFFIKH